MYIQYTAAERGLLSSRDGAIVSCFKGRLVFLISRGVEFGHHQKKKGCAKNL